MIPVVFISGREIYSLYAPNHTFFLEFNLQRRYNEKEEPLKSDSSEESAQGDKRSFLNRNTRERPMLFSNFTITARFLIHQSGMAGLVVDRVASLQKYNGICREALQQRFPGAEVKVEYLTTEKRRGPFPCLFLPNVKGPSGSDESELASIATCIMNTIWENRECWTVFNKEAA